MGDEGDQQPTPGGGGASTQRKSMLAQVPDIPPRNSSRTVSTSTSEPFGPAMSPRFNPADQFASLYQELRKPSSRTSIPAPLAEQGQEKHDIDAQEQNQEVSVSDDVKSSSFRLPSLDIPRPVSAGTRSVSTRTRSRPSSIASTSQTNATSLFPLQAREANPEGLEPLDEEEVEPGSFDLLAPPTGHGGLYPLERLAEQLFSKQHLEGIFADPLLLRNFSAFIRTARPGSAPLLSYYLDSIKALKAIDYANSVMAMLKPLDGLDFSRRPSMPTQNKILEERASLAFQTLVDEELPAFITQTWIRMASISIKKRITGTLSPHLRQMSEGLAEVFCLTDPKREDNPIIFASEGMYLCKDR